MMSQDDEMRYDSLMPMFKNHLIQVLSIQKSIGFPFEKLSENINIVSSTDHRLRLFSWDERTGGSWHIMASFAQFINKNEKVFVQQLGSDDEAKDNAWTDVIFYKIYQFEIEEITNYLLFGWGTYGSGNQHELIQVFYIKNKILVKCTDCMYGKDKLVIVYPRVDDIELKFDENKKEISYNDFYYDEDTEISEATGLHKTLKLIDSIFQE